MSAVQNLCSRAILLRRGRLVGEGETSKVVETYISKPKTTLEEIPLAERQDRNGNGLFRFVDASVGPLAFASPAAVRTGKDAVIKIWLRNATDRPLRGVDVSIGIDNYIGERITIFTTAAAAATLSTLPPGVSLIEFRVPNLPLVPGRYSFTLFGTASGEIADWVQSAASFAVESGDFYGTGVGIPAGQGSILVPYSVESQSPESAQSGETERIGHHR
jgi:lipopolysaccharide transport system ATP-binding protein